MPAKEGLLSELQEEMAGKEEVQLRRLINESEEIAHQRDAVRKQLTLFQTAAREISAVI